MACMHETVLKQIDAHTLALIINPKSRIIMADGRKILDKTAQIHSLQPDMLNVSGQLKEDGEEMLRVVNDFLTLPEDQRQVITSWSAQGFRKLR
jgi:hypothetical protein